MSMFPGHADLDKEIEYNKSQLKAWEANKAQFGDALPEADNKIAYYKHMVEVVIPEIAASRNQKA